MDSITQSYLDQISVVQTSDDFQIVHLTGIPAHGEPGTLAAQLDKVRRHVDSSIELRVDEVSAVSRCTVVQTAHGFEVSSATPAHGEPNVDSTIQLRVDE